MLVYRGERASDAWGTRGSLAVDMWARGAPSLGLTLFAVRSLVAAGGLISAISGCAETQQTALVIDVFSEQAVVDQAEGLRLRVVEDRDGVESVVFDEVRSRPVAGLDLEWLVEPAVVAGASCGARSWG